MPQIELVLSFCSSPCSSGGVPQIELVLSFCLFFGLVICNVCVFAQGRFRAHLSRAVCVYLSGEGFVPWRPRRPVSSPAPMCTAARSTFRRRYLCGIGCVCQLMTGVLLRGSSARVVQFVSPVMVLVDRTWSIEFTGCLESS